jgi:hypothetical protein
MRSNVRARLAGGVTVVVLASLPGSKVAGQAPTSNVEIISITPGGTAAGGETFLDTFQGFDKGRQKISADNRYVVFASASDQLVPGDTNGHQDIFVRDRQSGTTTLVSRAADGTSANDDSSQAAIYAACDTFARTPWLLAVRPERQSSRLT